MKGCAVEAQTPTQPQKQRAWEEKGQITFLPNHICWLLAKAEAERDTQETLPRAGQFSSVQSLSRVQLFATP